MGKIFCLMGKSGSGKDTIFKEIIKDKSLNLNPIIGYTTRPKRTNETNGVEYYFIQKEKLKYYNNQNKVIEMRKYNTIKGDWYYATIDDGQINLELNNYIIIVTLEAYKNLKNYYGIEKIVPIYITLNDGIRLERALFREKNQNKPNYNEMCRRFLADNIDFSNDKLLECSIYNSYENCNLDICVKLIKNDIKNIIKY